MIGAWKDYEDLESSLSMPELTSSLAAKREQDRLDKKFFAALQGVDLDGDIESPTSTWEDKLAAAKTGGRAQSANDIISLTGRSAEEAGFGIGFGLDYELVE